ncbi:MAG: hypothetical protein JWN37_394 [Candidatus Nomurabacteria bacterium]|nr:hypothetical protein [Candidatus Nomurabacteria bacterium]
MTTTSEQAASGTTPTITFKNTTDLELIDEVMKALPKMEEALQAQARELLDRFRDCAQIPTAGIRPKGTIKDVGDSAYHRQSLKTAVELAWQVPAKLYELGLLEGIKDNPEPKDYGEALTKTVEGWKRRERHLSAWVIQALGHGELPDQELLPDYLYYKVHEVK